MSEIISVIIPVYNGEKFIARAIESVLKQTLPAFEIIVINDGSKDGTEKILEQYAGKIIYKTIANGGVSNARNVGIALSRGDWIAFLDADDIWYPEKLEQQTAVLKQNSSAGFICTNYQLYNSALGKKVDHFSILKNNPLSQFNTLLPDALGLLIDKNFVGTASSVLVKKEVLNKAGFFNTTYRQAEDYDLWLRCSLVTDFILVPEVLLDKGTHESNLTNNQLEMWQFHNRVLTSFLTDQQGIISIRKLETKIGLALANKSYQMGNILYERQEFKEAYRYYLKGLKYSHALSNIKFFLWVIIKKTARMILRAGR